MLFFRTHSINYWLYSCFGVQFAKIVGDMVILPRVVHNLGGLLAHAPVSYLG